MNQKDLDDYIFLKIVAYDSIAKCISILRKYTSASMGEIKEAIESNDFVYSSEHISHPGVKRLAKCYDELTAAGVTVEIYELGMLCSRDIIDNLIESHAQTEREVDEDIERELAEDGE